MSTRSRSVIRLVRPDHAEQQGPSPAEPELESSTIWWEVFAFFMEGFALYGAALHPTAAMPVQAMLAARRDWQPHADDDEGIGNVVTLDRVRPHDAQPEHRWTWRWPCSRNRRASIKSP